MKYTVILVSIVIQNALSLLVSGKIPISLDGRRILLNGPSLTEGIATEFDGIGCITSVVFRKDTCIVSNVNIPNNDTLTFPLSDYLERDYMKILSKLPYTFE